MNLFAKCVKVVRFERHTDIISGERQSTTEKLVASLEALKDCILCDATPLELRPDGAIIYRQTGTPWSDVCVTLDMPVEMRARFVELTERLRYRADREPFDPLWDDEEDDLPVIR